MLLFFIRIWLNGLALVSRKQTGKSALKLFFTPRKGRVKPREREFLDTAQPGTVEAEGLKVQYWYWPNAGGPTVLLAHGWESNSARWRKLVQRLLEKGFSVVSLDAPAHGDSGGMQFSTILYAAFMKALLRKIPVDHAVGHSAGGMAIVYYLAHEPEHIFKKIVLLGTPGTFRALLNMYTNMLKLSNRAKAAIDYSILRKFKKPVEYFSILHLIREIPPTSGLIIHDEGDKIAPFDEMAQVHQIWENAKLVATKGLGHSVQSDQVNNEVLAFLQEN
jgi:pimeloyl-ACP methyl ester carboxylesterase